MNLQQLDKFHKTRPGYLAFGVVELCLCLLFLSLAINSGSLWQWGLSIVLVLGAVGNLAKVVAGMVRGAR